MKIGAAADPRQSNREILLQLGVVAVREMWQARMQLRLNWTNWKNEEADQRIEREAVDKPAN